MGSMRTAMAMLLGVGLLAAGCGSSQPAPSGGPQTAAEKQRLEFEASGEEPKGGGGKWGAWKYQGDRDECFFVFERECYKTEAKACKAAACGKGETCKSSGGGPVIVTCE